MLHEQVTMSCHPTPPPGSTQVLSAAPAVPQADATMQDAGRMQDACMEDVDVTPAAACGAVAVMQQVGAWESLWSVLHCASHSVCIVCTVHY